MPVTGVQTCALPIWCYLLQLGEGGITPHCLGEGDHPWVANLVVIEAEREMARVGEGECEGWGEGGVCEK